MSNFTKSILYSGVVLAMGLIAIFAISTNMSPEGSQFSVIEPAAGIQMSTPLPEGTAEGYIYHEISEMTEGAYEATEKAAMEAAETATEAVEKATESAAETATEAATTITMEEGRAGVAKAFENAPTEGTATNTTADGMSLETMEKEATATMEKTMEEAADKASSVVTTETTMEATEPAAGDAAKTMKESMQ